MATEMWQRLRAARKAAGLTQLNVARALGITRSGYAFLEWAKPVGRVQPSAAQVQVIARLTKVPVDMLMSDAAEESDIWHAAITGVSEPRMPEPHRPTGAPDSRTRENFWRAVEFSVVTAAPELAPCFAREVGPLGTTACFISGRRLIEFARSETELRCHVANTLMVEAAVHRACDKHLLVWGAFVTPELRAVEKDIHSAFGVRVHEVADGQDAANLILSLRA